MNKPKGWTFLCIWYENSWFGVHEIKRLAFPFYMALCIPFHLRQRTSRVYQDLRLRSRALTSFVPPVHIQGVSLAPLQGLALWKSFLPTTGSFFVLNFTDFFLKGISALFSGRFPDMTLLLSSRSVMAGFSTQSFLNAQSNHDSLC